jgi:hypothetical protein
MSSPQAVDLSSATEAIAELRSIMQLDGGDLVVAAASPEEITVNLVLDNVSCLDCIMRRPTIESMLTSAANKRFPSPPRVVLNDPREQS